MAIRIKPARIRLEASSHCQLRCPSCPTTTKEIDPVVGKGFLQPSHFRDLLDDNPTLRHVELSNYGEIFLNPEILEIMAYAHEKGVTLSAFNGANLNSMKPEIIEGMVKYQFNYMTCSIDGATDETYRKYRVRGSLDKVLGNLRKINEAKKRHNSKFPILKWQFILFDHNRHEVEKARLLAESLNMAFRVKLSWDDDPDIATDGQDTKSEDTAKVMSREAYREKHGREFTESICDQLWLGPQVNWDGKCSAAVGIFGAILAPTPSPTVWKTASTAKKWSMREACCGA